MSLLLAVKDGNKLFTVDEVTEEWKLATPERRFLHLMPQACLSGEHLAAIGRRKTKLMCHSEALGAAVTPEGGVRVRRLHRSYHVIGGSRHTCHGWLVEIPADLAEVDASFLWQFYDFPFYLDHRFRLTLDSRLESDPYSTVYSMDALLWPRNETTPGLLTLHGMCGGDMANKENRDFELTSDEDDLDYTQIHENANLPAVSLAKLIAYRSLRQRVQFGEEEGP